MKFLSRLSLAALFIVTLSTVDAQSPAPDSATKPATRDPNWMKTHERLKATMDKGGVDVLFVGDSITQGWNGKDAKKVWDEKFKAWNPGNIGIGGDRTQHVLWRITEGKEIEKIDPKVVVLMIGTNNSGQNTAEQIAEGVTAIVNEIKKQKPKAKILLLGVFPRAGKGPAKDATEVKAADLQPKIKAVNDIIGKLDDGGKTVKYLDIGKVFLDSDGDLSKKIMPDYLHLSGEGYAKWAEAIADPVNSLLK